MHFVIVERKNVETCFVEVIFMNTSAASFLLILSLDISYYLLSFLQQVFYYQVPLISISLEISLLLSSLKNSFAAYRIIGYKLQFSANTLTTLQHLLVLSSDGKSVISIALFPEYKKMIYFLSVFVIDFHLYRTAV